MPRQTFERELQDLQDNLLSLGSMVEKALLDAVKTLERRDMKASRKLIAQDRAINEERYAIESETLALIATQQPTATDLRTLAAILEIAIELERIGDYAKGIANINLMLGDDPLLKPLIDIPVMAQKACSMLHRALDAFVRRDVDLAYAIPADDDEVDALYNQVYRELVTYILEDPKCIEQSNYLLWVAHNLERTADRVTNICERVIFTVTGKLVDIGSENQGIESLG
jgi:phosphate transport system protein